LTTLRVSVVPSVRVMTMMFRPLNGWFWLKPLVYFRGKAKFTNEVQENIFLKNKNKYFYVLLEVGNNFRSEAQRSYSDFQ